ncbi:WXG100 family type VII secretion target [Asanoa siamensis]|uniref:ESAT-6-like protein n=1 Tax=Asanoa siamensis TaxID=926357 RepID=A0ABQ4CR69_9ACTN|nr:WXG100 family type VII secretion target [Asanoa siamensis]GIF73785.1 hypothetical protein Asi02nite_33030 [Asanoa siamensis]
MPYTPGDSSGMSMSYQGAEAAAQFFDQTGQKLIQCVREFEERMKAPLNQWAGDTALTVDDLHRDMQETINQINRAVDAAKTVIRGAKDEFRKADLAGQSLFQR